MFLSFFLSICLPPFLSLFISLSLPLSLCLYLCLCLSLSLSVLSLSLSVSVFLYVSVYLSAYLSLSLSRSPLPCLSLALFTCDILWAIVFNGWLLLFFATFLRTIGVVVWTGSGLINRQKKKRRHAYRQKDVE